MRPAMYNGIRHFMFVLPPLAVLGGLAAAYLLDALGRIRVLQASAAALLRGRHRAAGCRDGAHPSV